MLLTSHFGEIMALLAAFIFSWTSVFFTTAGRRLGVTTVNLFRLPGAALCLTLTHRVLTGSWWPTDVAGTDQFWIGLSGVVGLAIGDSALFKAFTLIGPRRSMTMMALAPVFTVIVAWSALGEHLGLWALGGIVLIIGGVVAANAGRTGTGTFGTLAKPVFRLGIGLALIGSLGQGLGSVFAKMGMMGTSSGSTGLDPLGATLIRIFWATVCYWLVVLPRQDFGALRRRLRDRRGVGGLGGRHPHGALRIGLDVAGGHPPYGRRYRPGLAGHGADLRGGAGLGRVPRPAHGAESGGNCHRRGGGFAAFSALGQALCSATQAPSPW